MIFERPISLMLGCVIFLASCGTYINHNSTKYYNIEEAEDYASINSKDSLVYHYFIDVNDSIYELTDIMKYHSGDTMIITGVPQKPSLDYLTVKAKMDTVPRLPVSDMMLSYIPQIHLQLKNNPVKIGERIKLTDSEIRRIIIYYYQKDKGGTSTAILVGGVVIIAGLIFWGLQQMSFNSSN